MATAAEIRPGRKPSAIGAAKAAEATARLVTLQSAAAPAAAVSGAMDRDFIARNQIVERYLSGKLPVKGATDFERFCHDNPQLLDELGLPERVNAGVRLLEASGKPEPWHQPQPRKQIWERIEFIIGVSAVALILAISLLVVWSSSSGKTRTIEKLKQEIAAQPIEPASSTRTIHVLPSRSGASDGPAVVVSRSAAQLVDLKIDMVRSDFHAFRVTVDRVDQGRVMVLSNLLKDSNGHLRIALNSSALGPGNYLFTIEGLTWRGETVPDAWMTIGVTK